MVIISASDSEDHGSIPCAAANFYEDVAFGHARAYAKQGSKLVMQIVETRSALTA